MDFGQSQPVADTVSRECLIFEAGEYPDRGVTITASDLESIAKRTAKEIPVKIEHMPESPFDGALGVITDIRANGGRLWGTLKQSGVAWQFIKKAKARALSAALDIDGKRLLEVSFVRKPRIAAAQVFGQERILFSTVLFDDGGKEDGGAISNEGGIKRETTMTSVKQFAEGLIRHVRSVVGNEESEPSGERAWSELTSERDSLREERVTNRIAEFKRSGKLRGTCEAEQLAKALLLSGDAAVVQFGGERHSCAALFEKFLEENGAVVALGESIQGTDAGDATERLISIAWDTARRDRLPFLTAFNRVSAEHPDMARAVKDEGVRHTL